LLEKEAVEGSTYIITVAFFDGDCQPMTPNSLKFWLADDRGNYINNRENVDCCVDSVVSIFLHGADLPGPGFINIGLMALYDSGVAGIGELPLIDQKKIRVRRVIP